MTEPGSKPAWLERPASGSRHVVNDLLLRARRFHVSVNGTALYDVTALRARLRDGRRKGRDLSLAAFLVKATATLIEEQPHLNRHAFTSWWGRRRIVEFSRIHCTLVVARRGPDKDDVLLPVVLEDANTLTIEQIEQRIRTVRSTPLAELPQLKLLQRADRAPRILLSWFSYKARSDPAFYLKTFGTYGLSSLVRVGGHGVGGATLANTGVAFLPASIQKTPRVVGDSIEVREMLTFGIVFDHLLFDGIEMLRATERLGELLEDPSLLLGAP